MQLLKPFLLAALILAVINSSAQQPKWLSYEFSKKVSLQTALIKIDNKPATYNDILKIADSSLLKVEVYSKKAAQQFVDKDEAKNGLVLVTLRKKSFIGTYTPKKDSIVYIINDNGDTVFCKTAIEATINGDTTHKEWGRFLERSLNPQVPADNGAPPGLYNVDVVFTVNKDGTVSDIDVPEDPGYGTAAEVKRLMNKSLPWNPAMCNDEAVKYREKERIVFW